MASAASRAIDAATEPLDTETLQKLIAELARAVPGPRASSPDPDRHSGVAPPGNVVPQALPLEAAIESQVGILRAASAAMQEPQVTERGLQAPVSFSQLIEDALRNERIATYLEPIQTLDQNRVRHFELSIRLRDRAGSELDHREVLEAAREAGLYPKLDAAKLPRALSIAEQLAARDRGADILTSIAALSIEDAGFQTRLSEALAETEPTHLVLSFTQDDVRDFVPLHWTALRAISGRGVRFALEDVFDLDLDFEALRSCGFSYVKLEANVLLAGLPSPSGLIPADHICRYLAALGFGIVVDRLDDEDLLARVMGFGVHLGKGSLFGGRRAVRSDLTAAQSAA